MTRHLTMEELLSHRDGHAAGAVRAHLARCDACSREYDRLAQRVAALRALGARRPPRDRWPVVRQRIEGDRRGRLTRRVWLGVTAAAASVAMAVALQPSGPVDDRPAAIEAPAIADLRERSQQLETALVAYGTDGRVMDGRTASLIADLEDRIALVDAGLSQARRTNAPVEDVTDLWRGRVELMDALVNAHVARASYVGF